MTVSNLNLPLPIEELRAILLQHGIAKASVFGSYARGDATPQSDLDILVELAPGRTYLDLGGLQQALDQRLPSRADVVLESTLRKRMRPYVERERVTIPL